MTWNLSLHTVINNNNNDNNKYNNNINNNNYCCCNLEKIREHKRNLAVAYYDYQKTYNKVHHDWMMKVYTWMGCPESIVKIIRIVIENWWISLKVSKDGKKEISKWLAINLQGDSFSPVGFVWQKCDSEGCRMGLPAWRNITRTHSLFIDDLKIYQKLKVFNEMRVQASFRRRRLLWSEKLRRDYILPREDAW